MKRATWSGLMLFLATISVAQESFLGTKSDTARSAAPTQSGTNFFQMIVAVGIVLALMKWVLPKLLTKFGGRLTTGVDSAIKLEESASFAGGTLQIVTVRGRTLLLGVSQQRITTLADLGSTNTIDPGPTFGDYLDSSPTVNTEDEPAYTACAAVPQLLNYAIIPSPTPSQSPLSNEVPTQSPGEPSRTDAINRIDALLTRK